MRNIVVFFFLIMATAQVCQAQVCGCTDPMATNYNPEATVNDGGCKYALARIKNTVLGTLDSLIQGTSSLFYWNQNYWTYNDHKDNCLYRIDSTNAATAENLCLKKIRNRDTEEIAQDAQYLYFGDMGNNSGKRKDLQILRIRKDAIQNIAYKIDTIRFSYEDQTDFTARLNATDFDCEAFVITKDSIYLFTKQWVSRKTTIYSLSKMPGTHVAHRRGTYNVKGLITGATYLPEYQLIVLCGYDYDKKNLLSALHPFVVLLYDFKDGDLLSGNKRRLEFNSGEKAQIEGIATSNGLDYYLTCEHFTTTQMGITFDFPAQLYRLDLRKYLLPYLKRMKNQ